MTGPSPQPVTAPPEKAARQRLLSLDVFRGITVAAMILVNNPGSWNSVYGPLKHAPWHGCTPADLVFPFFLFIVGVAITYALSTLKDQPEKHNRAMLRIGKRSLILFGLGLFLALFLPFSLLPSAYPAFCNGLPWCF